MSSYVLVGDDFNNAIEPHQTEILNDVQISLGQKQLTAPVFLNNKNLQTEVSGEMQEIILLDLDGRIRE